jgi:alcohol oxidase
LSVLVIERGQDNRGVANIENPVFYLDHQTPASKTAIFYKGNKADQLAGREPIVPSGGTLGGGSSINFMMYTRAQRSDFDSWNTPGWSADELLPFLKNVRNGCSIVRIDLSLTLTQIETYHGQGDPSVHGYDGPVHTSDGNFRCTKSENDLINAAAKMGFPEITDLQALDSNNGFERWLRSVSKAGRRQDTATAYIHDKINGDKYPNLHILTESQVVRVLLDEEKRAVGVEYVPNEAFQLAVGPTQHPKMRIKARKLVVVSCGACGSPSVLERSGIGNPDVLRKAGVPLQINLPGVGHDYQDHHLLLYPYKTNLEPQETIDRIIRDPYGRQGLIESKNPILGWNGIDVSSKIRPTDADVAALGPEFQAAWDKDFKDAPDRPLMLIALICW